MESNRLSRRHKNHKRRSVNRSIFVFSTIAIILLAGLFLLQKFKNKTELEHTANQKTETIHSDAKETMGSSEEAEHQNEEDEQLSDDSMETADTDERQIATEGTKTKSQTSIKPENNKQDETNKQASGQDNLAKDQSATNQSEDQKHLQDKYHSIKKKKVSSDDPNVIKAYVADWPPIGTIQQEPHEATYKIDTVDWQEMVQAIKLVTPLDDIIIHWIGNNGPGKAIATVSTEKWDEIYRVYLSWVKHEGWKPTRIEQLEWLQIVK